MTSDPTAGSAQPAPAFPFSPQDALEFMQKMWNPLGIADSRIRHAGRGAAAAPAPGRRCRSRIRR